MKILERVDLRSWDYILYRTTEGYVLNVMFSSGMADLARSFRISPAEAEQDSEGLITLAEHIREHYEAWKDREISPYIHD